jgi:hypothetical protein
MADAAGAPCKRRLPDALAGVELSAADNSLEDGGPVHGLAQQVQLGTFGHLASLVLP